MKKKIAIFPGSFNPFHQGHLDILKKALKLFDLVYVCITINPDKKDNYDFEKRKAKIIKVTHIFKNVKVIINKDKFTANLARDLGINYLIRSARDNVDFVYEMELAHGNKSIYQDLETILFFPEQTHIKYNSTLFRHREFFKKVAAQNPKKS